VAEGSNTAHQTMQQTMEPGEFRKLRGSLTLAIAGMAIPILVLVDLRFLLAYAYVSPDASRVLGSIATVCMILSAITAAVATRATTQQQLARAKAQLVLTMLLGLVAWVLIGVQVVNHSINPLTHFGETFVTTLGTLDVYILFGGVALSAAWTRIRRLQSAVPQWGIFATVRVWQFIVLAWVVTYIVLYWI